MAALASHYDATVMYFSGHILEHATFRERTEREAITRAYRFCKRMGIRGFKILCHGTSEETGERIPCSS